MALSFYGFVIGINRILVSGVITKLKVEMKTKGLRIFLCITGIMIGLMWIGRIAPTIGKEIAPEGLDNYATLVIQAMDLGIIVPACFVISYLLRIKNRFGYILGAVIIVKAITLVLAVLSMGINMTISGRCKTIFIFYSACTFGFNESELILLEKSYIIQYIK